MQGNPGTHIIFPEADILYSASHEIADRIICVITESGAQ
jgi:hypothetical protein